MAATGTQIQRYYPEGIAAEGGFASDRDRPIGYGCTGFNGCRERSICKSLLDDSSAMVTGNGYGIGLLEFGRNATEAIAPWTI